MSSLSEQISELQRTATYQRYRADGLRDDVICLREENKALAKALAELRRFVCSSPKHDECSQRKNAAIQQAERLLGRREG